MYLPIFGLTVRVREGTGARERARLVGFACSGWRARVSDPADGFQFRACLLSAGWSPPPWIPGEQVSL